MNFYPMSTLVDVLKNKKGDELVLAYCLRIHRRKRSELLTSQFTTIRIFIYGTAVCSGIPSHSRSPSTNLLGFLPISIVFGADPIADSCSWDCQNTAELLN